MNWQLYKDSLERGDTVQFRPRGNSMMPLIFSGNLVTVEPIKDHKDSLKGGDIVFCKVGGRYFVHLLKAVSGDTFLISNNKGRINGTISINQIYGKVVQVEA